MIIIAVRVSGDSEGKSWGETLKKLRQMEWKNKWNWEDMKCHTHHNFIKVLRCRNVWIIYLSAYACLHACILICLSVCQSVFLFIGYRIHNWLIKILKISKQRSKSIRIWMWISRFTSKSRLWSISRSICINLHGTPM